MESDLHTVIRSNLGLTEHHHRYIMLQLLRTIKMMHENRIIHRDLKPQNILANSDSTVRICDLGLAKRNVAQKEGRESQESQQSRRGRENTSGEMTGYVATRWYRAPELLKMSWRRTMYAEYGSKVDMWAIGCIFAEIILGKPLFPGKDKVDQLRLIETSRPINEIFSTISTKEAISTSKEAISLLEGLLAQDPDDRLSAEEALEHPYFRNHFPQSVSTENYSGEKQELISLAELEKYDFPDSRVPTKPHLNEKFYYEIYEKGL